MIADELLRRSIVIARNLLSNPGRNATEEADRQFITDVHAYLVEYAIPPNPQEVPELKAVRSVRQTPKAAERAQPMRSMAAYMADLEARIRDRADYQPRAIMPPYDVAVHGPRPIPLVRPVPVNHPRPMMPTSPAVDESDYFRT